MVEPRSEPDPVEALAEEFLARYRHGERLEVQIERARAHDR